MKVESLYIWEKETNPRLVLFGGAFRPRSTEKYLLYLILEYYSLDLLLNIMADITIVVPLPKYNNGTGIW